MSGWFETYRGVVFPWHCDQYGHLNVRWYAHFFDDASFHLWNRAGVDSQALLATGIAMVTARNTTTFRRELRAGDLLVVQSGISRVGTKSVGHVHRMRDANGGVLCATMESVEVFFDTVARASAAMPDPLRERFRGCLLEEQELAED